MDGDENRDQNRLVRWLGGLRETVRGTLMSQHPRREIDDLRRLVSDLEAQLAEAEEQITSHRHNLEALLSISEATGGDMPLEHILQHVLQKVFETTGYSAGAIRLLDQQCASFALVTQQGMTLRMMQDLQNVPIDQAFQAEVAQTHQPVYTSDLAADPRVLSPGEIESGYQSLICIPLLASQHLVGTMELATGEEHSWQEEEIRWLASIGRQIGATVHLVRLSQQGRDLAILQERERLSQELHDGLAQTIGSLRMRAEEALLCLDEGQIDAARSTLREVERIGQEAYSSIRDDILGLRVKHVAGDGLLPVMAEYLSRFQREWGIEVNCVGTGDGDWGASPEAEIQLIRIVQEALTNVRRHAQASHVIIKSESNDDSLRMTIADDGCGFDPTAVCDERIGLRIMRERASSVGGRLHIESCAGEGTQITVEMPRPGSVQPCRCEKYLHSSSTR